MLFLLLLRWIPLAPGAHSRRGLAVATDSPRATARAADAHLDPTAVGDQ